MHVGVLVFLTEHTGEPGAIAHNAEQIGFESFWVGEHLAIPVHSTTHYPRSGDGKVPEHYAHWAESFVALSAAARATSRIRLGTGICLLPERNVIATAKAAATLDMYSQGRLILGVGACWLEEEAQIMGVNFRRRWQHLHESVEALRELWTKDEASYAGEFINFPPVKLFPKPVQKPTPRILLGAHDIRYAPKRVARFCDGWCPANLTLEQATETLPQIRRLAQEVGRNPDDLEFSVILLARDSGPDIDTMKRYQEVGVTRLIVIAQGSQTGSGIEAVKHLAPVVEQAQRI